MLQKLIILIIAISISGIGCSNEKKKPKENNEIKQQDTKPREAQSVKYPGYEIIDEFPHDSTLFTQGLFYYNGFIYESGGMRGKSRLVKTEIGSGKIIKEKRMPNHIFSEGICRINDKIFMLTYTAGECKVFDINTFEEVNSFNYFGEGWGIEHQNNNIYMSDGTSTIRVLNKNTFTIDSTLYVT